MNSEDAASPTKGRDWRFQISLALQILALILPIATIAAAIIFTVVIDSSNKNLSGLVSQVEVQISDIKRQQEATSHIVDRFESMLQMIEGMPLEQASIAMLRHNVRQIDERLASVEDTLDVAPEEIVDVLVLQEKLSILQENLDGRSAELLREVDRAYTTVLTLVASLFGGFILLVLSNLIQRRGGSQ